jgi:Dna[CI] antecedent, DciA
MNNDDLHKAQETNAHRRSSSPSSSANSKANPSSSASSSSKDAVKEEQDNARTFANRIKRGRRSISSIDSVLSKLVTTLGLDKRLKEHALLNLWPMMIGPVFSDKSRPLFIDHESNLVIAVKDASVAQELSLMKSEIIKKMRVAAHSLGLKINGMRFDLKHYYGGTPSLSDGERFQVHKQTRRPEPTPEELDEINLSDSDMQELAALKAELPSGTSSGSDILKNLKVSDQAGGESMCIKAPKLPASSSTPGDDGADEKETDLNNRIFYMFEQELKLRQWRRKQGFPLCPKCQQPTQSLHGAESLCADCYFTTLANARDI